MSNTSMYLCCIKLALNVDKRVHKRQSKSIERVDWNYRKLWRKGYLKKNFENDKF